MNTTKCRKSFLVVNELKEEPHRCARGDVRLCWCARMRCAHGCGLLACDRKRLLCCARAARNGGQKSAVCAWRVRLRVACSLLLCGERSKIKIFKVRCLQIMIVLGLLSLLFVLLLLCKKGVRLPP